MAIEKGKHNIFNISARFWLNAQAFYDLGVAEDRLQRTVEHDMRPSRERAAGQSFGRVNRRTIIF
jgi:plasmid maintenance system antidote protein VapI